MQQQQLFHNLGNINIARLEEEWNLCFEYNFITTILMEFSAKQKMLEEKKVATKARLVTWLFVKTHKLFPVHHNFSLTFVKLGVKSFNSSSKLSTQPHKASFALSERVFSVAKERIRRML
ncbi:CLUMA_CG010943, isoform A [Clunio marinus]|uniref:CLUMA_CG010943, isoform A n=1 Tax=Clunio marinus TaxID=568069 RepID=A0A1J1IB98_9DIPT|nr:CLUMA_CG010943, isoform A [Clunio marinus]